MSNFTAAVQPQLQAAATELALTVQRFFREDENRTGFEQWYKERTGKDYEWGHYE